MKNSDRFKRGASLNKCFKFLLRAVLMGDLGRAQAWHKFIYSTFPVPAIEKGFGKLFKGVV
jgi:hypothetical protein